MLLRNARLPPLAKAAVGTPLQPATWLFALGCCLPLMAACEDQPTQPPPPSPPPPAYEIEIRYVSGTDPPAEFRQKLEDAAARWERVIVGDLPSMQVTEPAPFECEKVTVPPMDEEVDDLVVWVEVGPLDGQGGFGGFAGVCRTRGDHLPAVSSILFDEADFIGETLAAHEFGHAVGFGEVWLEMGLLVDPVNPSNGGPGGLEPVADATIAEGSPNENFGLPGASPLSTNLVAGKNLGDWTSGPADEELRALLRWDLSGLNPTTEVLEATVLFEASAVEAPPPPDGAPLWITDLAETWSETTVTWSNRPVVRDTITGGTFDDRCLSDFASHPSGVCTYTISRLVREWMNGSVPNHGLMVSLADFESSDAYIAVHSRHNSVAGFRPRISINLDTHFIGTNAIGQFDALGGAAYPGPKVPVENDYFREGELVDGHWRSFFMTGEVMSSTLFMTGSLSAITVGALEDMGYEVDYSRADPFEVNNVP